MLRAWLWRHYRYISIRIRIRPQHGRWREPGLQIFVRQTCTIVHQPQLCNSDFQFCIKVLGQSLDTQRHGLAKAQYCSSFDLGRRCTPWRTCNSWRHRWTVTVKMFYYITVSSSPRRIPEKSQHNFSDADQPFSDGLYNAQAVYISLFPLRPCRTSALFSFEIEWSMS